MLKLTDTTAPMVINRPMSGESFLAYRQHVVVPLRHGDVMVFDQLPADKGRAIREALVGADAALLCPPQNPAAFNPIDEAFAKLLHRGRL